jgi:hypothetical protein
MPIAAKICISSRIGSLKKRNEAAANQRSTVRHVASLKSSYKMPADAQRDAGTIGLVEVPRAHNSRQARSGFSWCLSYFPLLTAFPAPDYRGPFK